MLSKSEQDYYQLRVTAGLFAIDNTPDKCVETFGKGKSFHRYWKTKLLDPTFHCDKRGGKRYSKFGRFDNVVHSLVWSCLKANPASRPKEVCNYLRENGVQINTQYIYRLFHDWRWNRKKPVRHQINKYKLTNIYYYCDYLRGVKNIPWMKLKYLDECHFVSKDCYRKYVYTPRGVNVIMMNTPKLDQSYSMTFMTNLANVAMPYFVTMRENSNSQWDFVGFIANAILEGHLVPGDFLICDNASVHWAQDSWDALDELLQAAHVKMRFLPTYSPELNPCELVFGDLKKYLGGYRLEDDIFWIALAKALATTVNFVGLLDKYSHCFGDVISI